MKILHVFGTSVSFSPLFFIQTCFHTGDPRNLYFSFCGDLIPNFCTGKVFISVNKETKIKLCFWMPMGKIRGIHSYGLQYNLIPQDLFPPPRIKFVQLNSLILNPDYLFGVVLRKMDSEMKGHIFRQFSFSSPLQFLQNSCLLWWGGLENVY